MPAPTAATKDIVSMLKMDAKSPHPKYPSQSIYAAQDENVAKSLMHRFEQGAKLRGIRAFEFDLITGLTKCFSDLWVPYDQQWVHCDVYFGWMDGLKCFFIEIDNLLSLIRITNYGTGQAIFGNTAKKP